MKELIPQELIERRIFVIRGQKVMIGMHLAELYGVETRTLIQKELAKKLEELEKKTAKHDTEIQAIFDAIKPLMTPSKPKRKPQIDFRQDPKW